MTVAETGGNERFLRCRYHGRRFGLDGSFQFMPEFEGVEGLRDYLLTKKKDVVERLFCQRLLGYYHRNFGRARVLLR